MEVVEVEVEAVATRARLSRIPAPINHLFPALVPRPNHPFPALVIRLNHPFLAPVIRLNRPLAIQVIRPPGPVPIPIVTGRLESIAWFNCGT